MDKLRELERRVQQGETRLLPQLEHYYKRLGFSVTEIERRINQFLENFEIEQSYESELDVIQNFVKKLNLFPESQFLKERFVSLFEKNLDFLHENNIYINKILGCGLNGCAFETSNENLVAKVTNNSAELDLTFYLFNNSDNPMLKGFAQISDIQIFPNQISFLPYYLVIKERVIPLTKAVDISTLIEFDEAFIQGFTPKNFPFNTTFLYRSLDYFKNKKEILVDLKPSNMGVTEEGDVVIFDAARLKSIY